jgi:cell division protein FtsB
MAGGCSKTKRNVRRRRRLERRARELGARLAYQAAHGVPPKVSSEKQVS